MKKTLTFLFCIISFFSIGQSKVDLKAFATDESTIEWLTIKSGVIIRTDDFFNSYKTSFGLNSDYTFKLIKTNADENGKSHSKYQEYYRNVKIDGAIYILHSKNGYLLNANGKICIVENLSIEIQTTEEQALQIALNAIPSHKYLWEDALIIRKSELEGKNKSELLPKGELKIININFQSFEKKPVYKLAWFFQIEAANPHESKFVYIDDMEGKILFSINTEQNCNPTSAEMTWGNIIKPFNTSISGVNFILYDDCNSHGNIHTYYYGNSCTFCSDYSDSDNQWTIANRSGYTAHANARATLDFYFNYFGRNSYDNNGGTLKVFNEDNTDPGNSSWHHNPFDGDYITLGEGSSLQNDYDDFNTVDIVGHEITHAVLYHENSVGYGNNYHYESGALNEGFADIFGEAVERYFEGSTDWIHGADNTSDPFAIRSLPDPKNYGQHYGSNNIIEVGQPNTYGGDYWYSGSLDEGGVHINSGVLNHWFYLLSQGGSGTNDNGYNYSFSGIGFDKAIRIAYKTFCNYLIPTSVYGDAKLGSINAAIDSFGGGSIEVQTVIDAWCAVGLGTSCGVAPTCATPTNTVENSLTQTSVILDWSDVSGFTSYTIRYRVSGNSTWQLSYPATSTKSLTGLTCNTSYEWQVKTECSNGLSSAYSTLRTFATNPCSGATSGDNCSAPIPLVSSPSCSFYSSTVASMTSSGIAIPTCSVYLPSSTALDVWFSFVAQSSSHTITIDPEGNTSNDNNYLDAVIGIYSSCSGNGFINCYDGPGAGGATTIFTVNGLTVGNTYLIRVFDYGSSQPTYKNFQICITHNATTSNPDLIVNNPNLNISSVCAGNSVNSSCSVDNVSGVSTVFASTLIYYLSSNSTYSANDIQLFFDAVPILNGGANSNESETLTIPSGTSAGNWYILFYADANTNVTEGTAGEANNVAAIPISVTACIGTADITMQFNSVETTTPNPGSINITVNYDAENIGTADAPSNHIGIYLSTDNILNQSTDELIDTWTQTSLDIGEWNNDNLDFSIPNCHPCGSYYVFIVVDYLDIVPETNSTNNFDNFLISIIGCVTCSYSLTNPSQQFFSGGGSGAISVTTTNCCEYTAATSDSWIHISNNYGVGNSQINYIVDPCDGSNRSGTISVGGQTFVVNQECSTSCNNSNSFEWAVKAGGTGSDEGNSIATDASGNSYVTGRVYGTVTFGTTTFTTSGGDGFLVKYNSTGQFVWVKQFGGTGDDYGLGVTFDNAGNIYVAGQFQGTSTFGSTSLTATGSFESAFITKINSSGVFQWAKRINSSGDAVAQNICADASNNLFVTGDLNTGSQVFIAKYNSSGTQNWFESSSSSSATGKGITIDNSGNIYSTGYFTNSITFDAVTINAPSPSPNHNIFIAKFDQNANLIWLNQAGCDNTKSERGFGIIADGQGNSYLSGYIQADALDSSAQFGSISISAGIGNRAFVAKYNSGGNAQWVKLCSAGGSVGNDISFSPSYGIIQVGQFNNSGNYGGIPMNTNGDYDIFIASFDSTGNTNWVKTVGGTGNERATDVSVDQNNKVYITGRFTQSVTFNTTVLTSSGSNDIYNAKFNYCDLPTASILYSGSTSLCNGQTVSLPANYCNLFSYQWMLNNVNIPNETFPNLTANQTGAYKVKVSVFAGCETTSSALNLTFNNLAAPTITGLTTICTGGTTTLTADAGYSNYQWSTGAFTQSISVGAGTYSVTVTNSVGCKANVSVTVIEGCSTPTNVTSSNITGTTATITWAGNGCAIKYRVRYRVQGTTPWTTKIVTYPTSTKNLTLLLQFTTYEYQVRTDCNSTGTIASAYSPIQTFTTTCTCAKPTSITVTGITQTSATVNWSGNVCAYQYRVQYRKQGTPTWVTKTITPPNEFKVLTGLLANSIYEYRLITLCNGGSSNSGYTPIATFTTPLKMEDASTAQAITKFTVDPNPCSYCEVRGIENVNDLIVTDILGRRLECSFTKTTGGFLINMPEYENGFFLIRNIKTGQVVKFVKE